MKIPRRSRTLTIATTAIAIAGCVLAAPAASGQAASGQHRMTPAIAAPHQVASPTYVRATRVSDALFSCQQATAALQCYAPTQIRAAYNITPVLNSGITGARRTIVIVDAFGYPTVADDMNVFDTTFGLPAANLNVIAPQGQPVFDPNNADEVNWSGEIALDTQWAHAVAPGATIDLVIAKSDQDADILAATQYAVDHNLGDVISQSFGEAESCVDPWIARAEHQLFERATQRGITLIASSGDAGAAQPTCDGNSYLKAVSSPAVDPLVLAVGGTHLNADLTTGAYQSETVWNDEFGASGGGVSTQVAKPFYQAGIPGLGRHRGVPDVSYNGDVNGGVLTAWSQGDPANVGDIYLFGGTSAGSPQWAGITALADQKAHTRLGWLNPALYLIGYTGLRSRNLLDVVSGNNTVTEADANGNPVTISGYSAGRGWDATTGWGSPNVANLLSLLPSAHRHSTVRSLGFWR